MESSAQLIGISVGPGDPELITVKALRVMRECDVLFAPQAKISDHSVAKGIVARFDIPEQRFRTITFAMDRSRESLRSRYQQVADQIIEEIEAGKKVGFLTLGDALTFSTWIYTLDAVRIKRPDLLIETIPGVTSYAALASQVQQPLGEQKERVLILPCPDDMENLRREIESHDLVVLMKIGHRFDALLDLIKSMGLEGRCVLGRKVGMDGGEVFEDLRSLPAIEKLGYFSTMLIRGE
ncbi:MAG: precorrin-2 C(20)-methyltransferase [Verrucomicrobiales bacterium]|nr:precorrin-2 C(20)-methyltransferase [Verrucomicrobiales bacterium]